MLQDHLFTILVLLIGTLVTLGVAIVEVLT